jgi:nitroimidazol reductase NimA-like FMN-containing flavoprotein (pyridoxamine 5'-phosphate oxidase superfamily)
MKLWQVLLNFKPLLESQYWCVVVQPEANELAAEQTHREIDLRHVSVVVQARSEKTSSLNHRA